MFIFIIKPTSVFYDSRPSALRRSAVFVHNAEHCEQRKSVILRCLTRCSFDEESGFFMHVALRLKIIFVRFVRETISFSPSS